MIAVHVTTEQYHLSLLVSYVLLPGEASTDSIATSLVAWWQNANDVYMTTHFIWIWGRWRESTTMCNTTCNQCFRQHGGELGRKTPFHHQPNYHRNPHKPSRTWTQNQFRGSLSRLFAKRIIYRCPIHVAGLHAEKLCQVRENVAKRLVFLHVRSCYWWSLHHWYQQQCSQNESRRQDYLILRSDETTHFSGHHCSILLSPFPSEIVHSTAAKMTATP